MHPRAQPVPDQPGFQAHFSLFCLASAAHERAGHGFTVDALFEQMAVLLSVLHGPALRDEGAIALRLLATPAREHLAERLEGRLRERWPSLPITSEELRSPYYDGLRFMIDLQPSRDELWPVADGGAFDWLHRLASNRRLAFVASGLGTQLLALASSRACSTSQAASACTDAWRAARGSTTTK